MNKNTNKDNRNKKEVPALAFRFNCKEVPRSEKVRYVIELVETEKQKAVVLIIKTPFTKEEAFKKGIVDEYHYNRCYRVLKEERY